MIPKKLKSSFFIKNPNLIQALHDKGRGYGIIVINYENLKFAIPLHSNINHNFGFTIKTYATNNGVTFSGLDYQKALIINDSNDIGCTFRIDISELNLIRRNKLRIESEFSNYVQNYIYLHRTNKQAEINHKYRHSTLQNYKRELKIGICNYILSNSLLSPTFILNRPKIFTNQI